MWFVDIRAGRPGLRSTQLYAVGRAVGVAGTSADAARRVALSKSMRVVCSSGPTQSMSSGRMCEKMLSSRPRSGLEMVGAEAARAKHPASKAVARRAATPPPVGTRSGGIPHEQSSE